MELTKIVKHLYPRGVTVPGHKPGAKMSNPSITIDCPHCGEELTVVIPEETSQDQSSTDTTQNMESESTLDVDVESWKEVPPTDPYTGADPPRPPMEQKVETKVRVDREIIPVTVFYTKHKGAWDYWKYVVRAKTDAGRKSKDVFDSPDGLYLKNRGIPWTEDKDWTYLSKKECERRADLAGLGEVIPDPDLDYNNRFRLLLDEEEQPLVDSESELATSLVEKLTRGLLVLQSTRNPKGY